MKEQSTKTLLRKLNLLKKNISNVFPVMRGSVAVLGMKNKQPYFSVSINKKTNLVYLGQERIGAAKKCSTNYKKMMKLVDEITLINMELLKRKVDQASTSWTLCGVWRAMAHLKVDRGIWASFLFRMTRWPWTRWHPI